MIIEECKYGDVTYLWACYNDAHQLHREDGPARIERHKETGELFREAFYINGKYHRNNDLPAVISYNNGRVAKYWYINGISHRENGPAYQFSVNGNICQENYYKYGRFHRIGGPAKIVYNDDVIIKDFFIEGEYYPLELYNKALESYIKDYFKISGRIQ